MPEKPAYTPSFHEFFIAWATLFSGRGEIRFLPDRLLVYRQHPSQLAGAPRPGASFRDRVRALWRSRDYTKANSVRQVIERLRDRGEADATGAYPHWPELFDHYWMRATLPSRKWKRVIPVGSDLINMRYHKYSRGFRSALKDLLFVKSQQLGLR